MADAEVQNPASSRSGPAEWDSVDCYNSSDALAGGGVLNGANGYSLRSLSDIKTQKAQREYKHNIHGLDVTVEVKPEVRCCGCRASSTGVKRAKFATPVLLVIVMLLLMLLLYDVPSFESRGPLHLHLLDDPQSAAMDAVCLDGSPGAIYITPAVAGFESSWQFYLEGGGWCWGAENCVARGTTSLGSSIGYPATINEIGTGLVSSDCGANPTFCKFNQVFFKYCDGNSFSGRREGPLQVQTADGTQKEVWFRGSAVIDAALRVLHTQYGFDEATEVLLAGGSAGGLAVFLQANRIGDFLRANSQSVRYKVVPVSGFFIEHDNVNGESVYQDQMRSLFEMSGAIDGLSPSCIAAQNPGEEWKCNFAGPAYAHVNAPVFVINSALDAWQVACILTALPMVGTGGSSSDVEFHGHCNAMEAWMRCADLDGSAITRCSVAQMQTLIDFQEEFVNQLTSSVTFSMPQNSAFIYSCHTHSGMISQPQMWSALEVAGVAVTDAVSRWWFAPGGAGVLPPSLPCMRSATEGGGSCNPTCPLDS